LYRKVPQYKFAIIGTALALNGVCIVFANPHVPGIMQALIGPTIVTVPMSVLFSFLLLKTRYNWKQLLAVLFVIFGLIVAVWPSIFSSSDDVDFGSFKWNAIFLLGSVPLTLASIYEEKTFHNDVSIAGFFSFSTLWC
jgi:drug/metabolite transporter (DMT)-like permease